MAINTPNWGIDPYTDFNFKYKDIAIGGKLVQGTIRVPEHKIVSYGSEHEFKQFLKTSMAHQMCEYMISNGLVEFTQMRDNITYDSLVRARCYLAPNDQVKILRMHYAGT
jgi:hypothetical protein